MSEHAFDPASDHDDAPTTEGDAPVTAYTAPNATVTVDDVSNAVEDGHWTHPDASVALWLNTALAPPRHTVATLRALCAVHGVAVD